MLGFGSKIACEVKLAWKYRPTESLKRLEKESLMQRGLVIKNKVTSTCISMNLDIEDIPKIVTERGEWRCRVNSISASAVT